ncbi:PREDICTED: protein DGCR6-like isoform X2 [Acropora digitifera]|uniref:protein DGCR6-like n=1 Tax=Acropora millepora TaxID=45264 RepID=UPI00077ACB00|nr:PREDICTED: protein DGCR6-like isoform X1 [Acropora digitifera]XP_015765542.1 PREDICTED: protein DGCR6-like isoform X2 [Acropora digitifera]XP_029193646.1 protein DGCR6-like [Acropora millepora]
MSYFYGSGGGQRQPKWNYQPNLDSSLLATVRDEMLRKEEEYRREQQRIDTEKKKLTSYLTQLQAMVRDLPGTYKRKFTYDVLSGIATCLIDGTVFEIVKGLEDIQQLSERNLLNKRMKIVNSQKAQRMELSKKQRNALQSCEQRPHNLPLVEASNAQEKKALEDKLDAEISQVDQKVVLELDQLVSDQQATLQRAGVPLFSITNSPDEVRLQMYILDFIQRLEHSPT